MLLALRISSKKITAGKSRARKRGGKIGDVEAQQGEDTHIVLEDLPPQIMIYINLCVHKPVFARAADVKGKMLIFFTVITKFVLSNCTLSLSQET